MVERERKRWKIVKKRLYSKEKALEFIEEMNTINWEDLLSEAVDVNENNEKMQGKLD